MEIAKYAGLFFLRNEYIYLPGIGNLEVKKRASSYSTEYGSIDPGEREITFRPGTGVIEDSFSNFVANNERISIAAATNHIREFGAKAKHQLANNEQVEIPGVGIFTTKNGVITFETSKNIEYNPKPVKVFKNSTVLEEKREKNISEIYQETHFSTPTANDEIILEKPRVNYAKIFILALLGLLVLGAIGYMIYYFLNQPKVDNTNNIDNSVNEMPATVIKDSTSKADTTIRLNDSANNSSASVTSTSGNHRIIVNEYNNKAAADARVNKLKTYGYIPTAIALDSTKYVVTVDIPTANGPEQIVVDSIKRLLNPKFDVRILK